MNMQIEMEVEDLPGSLQRLGGRIIQCFLWEMCLCIIGVVHQMCLRDASNRGTGFMAHFQPQLTLPWRENPGLVEKRPVLSGVPWQITGDVEYNTLPEEILPPECPLFRGKSPIGSRSRARLREENVRLHSNEAQVKELNSTLVILVRNPMEEGEMYAWV
jgi:hypothetical protein